MRGGWWLLVVGAVGCAEPADGDGPDDSDADTDGGVFGELAAWDFEAPAVAPGDFVSWAGAPSMQPAEVILFGDGFDVGRYHPLTAQLATASPLAAPADGSHVVYLNVQPWGTGTEPNGIGTFGLALEDATVDGVEYQLTFAVAARLDLTWPDTTVQLLFIDGDGEVTVGDAEVAMTPPSPGLWREVTLAATAPAAGDQVALYVQLSNSAVEQQQVLLDAIRLSAR
jgi:hypothetical protein